MRKKKNTKRKDTFRTQNGRPESKWDKVKGEEREIKDTADEMSKLVTKGNAVEWYSKNQQLLVDTASLPFGYMLGTQTDLTAPGDTVKTAFRVPGVEAIYFFPTTGYSADLTSPINVAARNVFTTMRKKNSGGVNYDAPDLMMYLMAADSLYMFHSFMKRTYGIIRNYSPYNRYYTDTILALMGWNPRAIRQDIAKLRAMVNMMAAQLANLATPATMPLFDRHQWMCEGLYLDGDSRKAQTYVFVPRYYLKFETIADTQGSSLSYQQWSIPQWPSATTPSFMPDTGNTLETAQSFWDNLYTGIMLDEDFNTMSGDLARAFGDSSLTRIMPIPDDYVVLPVYNREVLSQIENATIPQLWYTNGTMPAVTQNNDVNNGAIIYTPTFTVSDGSGAFPTYGTNASKLLNMHWDDPTPGDVMVATRLMMFPNATRSGGVLTYSPYAFGSEIVCGSVIAIAPYEPTTGTEVVAVWSENLETQGGPLAQLEQGRYLCAALSTFDWHPIVKMYLAPETGDPEFAGILGDLDVYSIVHTNELRMQHEVAMLSLFNVSAGDIGLAGATK